MFNKNFFEVLEKKTSNAYSIKTSMATGHGLNGVSYDSFLIGTKYDTYDKDHLKMSKGEIISIEENFLVIEVWEYQTYCKPTYVLDCHNIIYLSYETIQSVTEILHFDKRWLNYHKGV